MFCKLGDRLVEILGLGEGLLYALCEWFDEMLGELMVW
jgi:hypothetical protein